MTVEPLEQRIIDLEQELALQRHTVDQLSDIIAEQQKDIDRLTASFRAVAGKIKAFDEFLSEGGVDDGPPPHY